MKIGILTLYDNRNFGNRLQNVALQNKLASYGKVVQTIKSDCKPGSGMEAIKIKSDVRNCEALLALLGKCRCLLTVRFTNKWINTTRKLYWCNLDSEQQIPDRYDICCVGSDQIWNPHYKRTAMFNYLGFADRDRTFSYAASFGVEEIPEQHKEAVRKGLEHIKFISVREDAGKRIVEELTGRTDVQVLADPTMLLTAEEWDKIARKPKAEVPEKYVLTYFLGAVSHDRRAEIARKAKEMDCQLIELMDRKSPFYAIGPDHFLYLIKHAALVCTDSFHGSIFSFLYQRPLVIFDRKGGQENMGSRLETLASKFGLTDCMAEGDRLPDVPETADYSKGSEALTEERKKANAFLNMVFEEAERAGLC